MKKNPPKSARRHQNWGQVKFFASLTLLFISMFPLSATSIAQRDTKITLSCQNASLETVLKKMARQADVKFVYNNARINKADKLNVEAIDEKLENVLDRILGDGFSWQLVDKYVVISARSQRSNAQATHEARPAQQQDEISGKVVSKDGEPLIGVSVVVKGTTTGVATDINGDFTIKVPARSVLVFSYIGYQTKEIAASPKMRIVLEEDQQQLDEVMVVAYGTTKKSSFTGSAVAVDAEVLSKRQASSVTQSLQSVAPGVQVVMNSGQPGENAQIRIRGISSLNTGAEPLWVIDGVPYEGLLNSINTDDIESITILKDAASAALYGARGANGVILATTKKGRKNQAPTVSFKATVGTSNRAVKEYTKLNAREWMEMQWEAIRNGRIGMNNNGLTAEEYATQNFLSKVVYNPVFKDGSTVANPVGNDGKIVDGAVIMWDEDWYDALTRTPLRQEYQMAVNGGSEHVKYSASLGYLNDEGTTLASFFKRYTARISVEAEITKWFNAGLQTGLAHSDQNYPPQSNSNIGFPYVFSRLVAPIYPVYKRNADGSIMVDENGEKVFDLGVDDPKRPVASGQNPRASLNLNTINYTRFSVDPTWWVQINILPELQFRNNIAINYWNGTDNQMYSREYADARGLGRQYKYRNNQMIISANQTLSYNKEFGRHNFGIMLGHEASKNTRQYLSAQKTGTFSDDYSEFAMATTLETLNSYENELTREGYFGRLNYDYDSRYFLEASYRRDASSRFYIDNCWGDFWSVSASWLMTREKFMENVTWLNQLKLRVSYGVQGNDDVLDTSGNADWYAWHGRAMTGYNYDSQLGLYYSKMENKNLTWEKNNSWNIGVDFAMFSRKLSGSVEFYNRLTSDMLFQLPLPLSNGFSSINRNTGEMVNRGLDVNLNIALYNSKKITSGLNLNLSYLHNEVTKLPQESILADDKQWKVGHGAYEFFMYEYAGVDETTGDALFWSGEGSSRVKTADISQADKYYVGDALPPVQLTLSPYINFYNFDFSFTLSGAFGHQVYDNTYERMMHTGGSYGTQWHSDIKKRWTPENTRTDVPKVTDASNSYSVVSSRFLFDADYLRMRALTLGYTFPKTWLNKYKIKEARIYFQADNLFTVKLGDLPTGTDPEVLSGTQSTNSTALRIMSVGVNLTF